MVARLEAVVRRHRRGEARGDVGPVVAGELEIRADQFEAYVASKPLGLTRREFLDLLNQYNVSLFDEEMNPKKEAGYG